MQLFEVTQWLQVQHEFPAEKNFSLFDTKVFVWNNLVRIFSYEKRRNWCLFIYLFIHIFIYVSVVIWYQWIAYPAKIHNNDVIMSTMASQITSVSIVCSTVCSSADQRKHQSSASLAFVNGIHRWPFDSPHKGPLTRKMSPFHYVTVWFYVASWLYGTHHHGKHRPPMDHSHKSQCLISHNEPFYNRKGALYDIWLMHCGICEMGHFLPFRYLPWFL